MLQQHLVVVISAEGDETHFPFVCQAGEVFENANRIFRDSGGERADVWRGADHLYSLGPSGEG